MSAALDDADRSVLEYANSMAREVHVPDDVFARLRERLSERH
jgi:hypothetical protein